MAVYSSLPDLCSCHAVRRVAVAADRASGGQSPCSLRKPSVRISWRNLRRKSAPISARTAPSGHARTHWTQRFSVPDEAGRRRRPARRTDQRQGRPGSQADRDRRPGRFRRQRPWRAAGRRRDRLSARPRAQRSRTCQHRRGRRRHALSLHDAAAAQNAQHRPAARRGGGRSGLVPAERRRTKESSSASSRGTGCWRATAAAGGTSW